MRIALALKGIAARQVSHHLRKGEQARPEYLKINPQGLVPTLVLDQENILTQSLAIMEYLEEVYPERPLLPSDPVLRAKVRAAACVIACDTHPVQNLRILERVKALAGNDASQMWARTTIEEGLQAFAALLPDVCAPYCFGEEVTFADICLVPQLANARRFGAKWQFGRLKEIEQVCLNLDAFDQTRPEAQLDAD